MVASNLLGRSDQYYLHHICHVLASSIIMFPISSSEIRAVSDVIALSIGRCLLTFICYRNVYFTVNFYCREAWERSYVYNFLRRTFKKLVTQVDIFL